jgi:hypothetical protein
MIGRLQGTLAEKNPPQVLVDCNGVGYEVDVPMSTFYNLPALGDKVSLLTHFVVREDDHPCAPTISLPRPAKRVVSAAPASPAGRGD